MGDFSILSKRIKELRNSLDMTQRQFSEKVGCTSATLSAYENSAKSPSLEIVKSVSEKCNVSLDWLCGLSEEKDRHAEIKTYADVLNILFQFDSIFSISITGDEGLPFGDAKNLCDSIRFNDRKMEDILTEWKKMQELHNRSTIDDEVYALWIEKTIKKYANNLIEKKDIE